MTIQTLNWHPAQENPLDYISPYGSKSKTNLATPHNEPVKITQQGTDFVVTIKGNRVVTGSNISTCYYLNQREVGFLR